MRALEPASTPTRRARRGRPWTTYYRATNPFEVAKNYVVVPGITSLLGLSPRTWQIRGTQEQRGLDGRPLGPRQWEAVVTTEIVPPTSKDTMHVNPLGLYVTELRRTKQL